MFPEFFEKNVRVTLKDGKVFEGFFGDAYSEYDTDGPATVIIGKYSLEENDIEKMEVIN